MKSEAKEHATKVYHVQKKIIDIDVKLSLSKIDIVDFTRQSLSLGLSVNELFEGS